MSLFRLELLRLRRTRRLIPLVAVFVIFGFGGPVLAYYLPDLIKSQTSENVRVIVTAAKPVDGVSMFSSNASQIGLLVALIIAAGILSIDAKPGLAAFYRTRVRPFDRVVLPRYVLTSAVVSASYVLGALCAWYETVVLLGHLDATRYVLGIAFTVAYLWFAVAVVTFTSSLARSVVGTAASAIGILLAMPIFAVIPWLGRWLPSTLVGAQVGLAGTQAATTYLRALGVALVATALVLVAALARLRHREI